jgi:excisionase family DNA binding protein
MNPLLQPSTNGHTAVVTPLLLKPRDAARSLAISERKLWQLTKDGEIQVVKVGRSVRYDPRDLQRWIDAQKKVSNEA